MKRHLKHISTLLKGMGMGAADVVPGVSGGTIAFLTGIYEELISSVNSLDMTAVKLLFSGRLKALWKHVNGSFLVSLFAGIFISVLSLAKVMQYLLATHPIQTWAFFFGLIVASSVFILKGIKGWKLSDMLPLAAGTALGVIVCTLSPAKTPDDLWFVFLCGAMAICAMILPGISGSFILLILGKYEYLMGAIVDMNVAVLAVFLCGAVTGILSFSKFLHWLLSRYHRTTLTVLSGFIIGSLVKVWPWSDMTAVAVSQYPELEGLSSESVSGILGMNPGMIDYHIAGAVCFALLGIIIVTGLELSGDFLRKGRETTL